MSKSKPEIFTIKMAETLEMNLKCKGCEVLPAVKSNVYQCEGGHIFCQACFLSVEFCSACNKETKPVRCLIAEEVLLQYPRDCKNSKDGCEIKDVPNNLAEHEIRCNFRKIDCPLISCVDDITLKGMKKHFKEKHQDIPLKIGKQEIYFLESILDEDYRGDVIKSPRLLNMDGHKFWNEMVHSAERNLWFTWVYIMGSSDEAKQFFYSVRLLSEDGSERVEFRGQTISIDIDSSTISQRSLGYEVSDEAMKRLSKSGKIQVHIRVFRKTNLCYIM